MIISPDATYRPSIWNMESELAFSASEKLKDKFRFGTADVVTSRIVEFSPKVRFAGMTPKVG